MLPEVCMGLAILCLTAYAVFGGADFGAGFWDLTAGGARRGGRIRALLIRSMTPVWEANHVWLPFLLVVLWTAFPVFFGSIMSTLLVPLLLGTVGIILRGAAFALRGQAETVGEARALGAMFAISSVAVPFAFGAALGAIASDRVPVGNATGDTFGSWVNPTGITVGVLSVLTGAFLAAVFLAGDAVRAGLDDLERAFRVRALVAGILTGAIALGSLLMLRSDAPRLYEGLTSGAGLALVLASAVAGGGTVALVAARRHELARVTASAAVACVTVGWAVGLGTELLPGLTLEEAAAGDATLTALLVSVAVGMVLLVPSMWLLFRLALRGDLGGEFEPLDRTLGPKR